MYIDGLFGDMIICFNYMYPVCIVHVAGLLLMMSASIQYSMDAFYLFKKSQCVNFQQLCL